MLLLKPLQSARSLGRQPWLRTASLPKVSIDFLRTAHSPFFDTVQAAAQETCPLDGAENGSVSEWNFVTKETELLQDGGDTVCSNESIRMPLSECSGLFRFHLYVIHRITDNL